MEYQDNGSSGGSLEVNNKDDYSRKAGKIISDINTELKYWHSNVGELFVSREHGSSTMSCDRGKNFGNLSH